MAPRIKIIVILNLLWRELFVAFVSKNSLLTKFKITIIFTLLRTLFSGNWTPHALVTLIMLDRTGYIFVTAALTLIYTGPYTPHPIALRNTCLAPYKLELEINV